MRAITFCVECLLRAYVNREMPPPPTVETAAEHNVRVHGSFEQMQVEGVVLRERLAATGETFEAFRQRVVSILAAHHPHAEVVAYDGTVVGHVGEES